MSRARLRSLTCDLALGLTILLMSFAPLERGFSSTAPMAPVGRAIAPPAAESLVVLRPSLDGLEPLETVQPMVVEEPGGVLSRWNPLIAEASDRFGVPKSWIRAVLKRESGGHTHRGGSPITSRAGAMGLMQLMPGTWEDLRREYGLGSDPYDPHDNIIAATAYLKWLQSRYGYPDLFAAYNHGPGNFERHRQTGSALPRETRDYLAAITANLRHTRNGLHARRNRVTLRLASI